ncbi:hypothetical protein B7P43_G04540 [Cryptotermes secundus]|uniref:Endosome-associated-trafficking regulator 1 n=1 Tax=Cryptotermes secundus TaxID=105785 RepID=A0A2J7QLN8_9NEOP|nr:uncharacterized protein LOC111866743 isoform X2 [Cryptotermes secundus]PNF29466.1 hypothetical protein B7P43_G04540 [Cryptotermes secundus]PNF29468.1 hypothetical protein B7P43_G04540 [Cryptotermes secundus]
MEESSSDEGKVYSYYSFMPKNGTEDNSLKPDLGLGNTQTAEKKGNDMPKREENPFSFKHFLKRDAGNNYSSTGARRKVHSDVLACGHLSPASSDSDPGWLRTSVLRGRRQGGTPELTSALPDFVQDHLVVEQCYLNHSESSNTSQIAVDIPVDLAGTAGNQNLPKNVGNGSGPVPLDLPSSDRSPTESIGKLTTHGGGLPFDLPLVSDAKDGAVSASSSGVRSGMQIGEVGVSKSLPDFLSDGPIHSGHHNDVDQPIDDSLGAGTSDTISGSQSPDSHRLQLENETLRRKLEVLRRQRANQARRIQYLERDIFTIRAKEHKETAKLEKAIELVEDNLKRTTRRAVNAEHSVSKLKQELKIVSNELTVLRQENRELQCGRSGAGASVEPESELQMQQLAHELRVAASTAEQSLRQLLNGVGNLRVIASTLENSHRIQDRTGDFLGDLDDEDDDAGPAL